MCADSACCESSVGGGALRVRTGRALVHFTQVFALTCGHLMRLQSITPLTTTMDRVPKAPVGPSLALSSPLKRRHSSCGVCRLKFNSEAQASSHYSGTRHAKRIKAMDAPESKIGTSEPIAKETASQILSSPSSSDTASAEPPSPARSSDAAPSSCDFSDSLTSDPTPAPSGAKDKEPERSEDLDTAPEDETEEEKAKRLLYCSLCKVAVNSASQLQAHNSGTKHKTMMEARSGDGAIKSFPRSGVKAKMAAASTEASTGLQNKTFHCEICDVHVNSETQLKQHISSRRHKDRAAGKPGKPKFSPYPPSPRNQHNFQTIQLALRKNQDLSKPLTSCLLQRQISVAAAMATTMHPFPLRPSTNSTPALFQSPALPHQAVLHQAPPPGTMCSSHGPLLLDGRLDFFSAGLTLARDSPQPVGLICPVVNHGKRAGEKKSFQESLEEIKEKMKEKRSKRLASVSAPNRGRSRTITKCNGTSSTNTILKGIQQNNQALAVALQAEKEKVRQANAVILQLKREQQALFLHLLLLKKKLKEQEALSANSSGNSSNNAVLTTTESQRRTVVETSPQAGSPLCAEGKPAKLPPTVGVRRRRTDRSSSSRRRSDRVQELKIMREDPGVSLETLTTSPICGDNAKQKQTDQSEEPMFEKPDEEFQHSTPEPVPAKNTRQPQPDKKPQTRAKAETAQKKTDRGRKVERGPLKKPWENPKPRARSKSRDRSATRSKTAPVPQNKLNTSLGFNDTFDFDCEEAVHVTPFKAKAEDDQPQTTICKEPTEEFSVASSGKDSLASPSSESEDSLYVPQKSRKKQASPENPKTMNTRRGRSSRRVRMNDEIVPPHKKFIVYRDADSSPKAEGSNKEEITECTPHEKEQFYEEYQTEYQEPDTEEHCLPLISPLVEAEIKRIDNVLSNFGESSNDNTSLVTDETPQRAKSCKKRGLGVRPAGRGLSLCDVTNMSPAAYRKIQRGGSRLSDVRCSTPALVPGRKRRCTMTVDYKEPSLSAKLRRGDKFTDVEFLRSPIFKQKSGRRSVQKSRSSMKMQQPFEKYNESFVGCR
ncbi:hypothetical protein WMY93_019968 [Mugilogobius chulae]|uniref:C2H2-type domain-containing protein n=1 Tax=Mugilogobius chulae TaxID=88201 RepID=A0AAW0NFS9_9GOBI